MTEFSLAHLSDPHLPPPPSPFRAADLASKRTLSRLAWRRKRRQHDPRVLQALVDDMKSRSPHHMALTGDLTNFSTPEEYAAAAAWLAGLGDPADVTISPGNHDALVRRAPGGFAPWSRWLGDGAEPDFPRVRRRGPVTLVNLSSAVATPPHSARGRLGPAQIQAAAAALRAAAGSFRVVLIHHPPADGLVSARKSLADAEPLRAALAEAGAELVLHGHAHAPSLAAIQGPDRPIPVLGVSSASSPAGGKHAAARWNEIAVSRDGEGFSARITVRGLEAGGGFAELGRYRL